MTRKLEKTDETTFPGAPGFCSQSRKGYEGGAQKSHSPEKLYLKGLFGLARGHPESPRFLRIFSHVGVVRCPPFVEPLVSIK